MFKTPINSKPFSLQVQFLSFSHSHSPTTTSMRTAAATADDVVDVGFAKLQGKDFEYYMQTYSILLGRNSKKSSVDVDLSSLGGGTSISRHHARIFYDFARRRFALEVLGKNGCLVEGVLHLPGNPSVKLDSQDLLRIGDKEFYFLLPSKSVALLPRHYPIHPPMAAAPGGGAVGANCDHHLGAAARRGYCEEEEVYDDDDHEIGGSGGKKMRKDGYEGYGYSGKNSMAAALG